MTRINETIAERVMGWHTDGSPDPSKWWYDRAGRPQTSVSGWSPLEDAEHAQMLRAKLAELGWGWRLTCADVDHFEFFMWNNDNRGYTRQGATEGEALCRCVFAMLGEQWPV